MTDVNSGCHDRRRAHGLLFDLDRRDSIQNLAQDRVYSSVETLSQMSCGPEFQFDDCSADHDCCLLPEGMPRMMLRH